MANKGDAATVLFFHSQQRDREPAEQKLRGIYRFARACGWSIITQEPPESSQEVREKIEAWHPRGCIVDMNESSKYFTVSSLGSTPTTFLDFDDRQSKGRAFRVNHNPETIGSLAARHLMSLGLRHFAFVGYTHEWSWSDARKRAFLSHLGKTHETFSSFDFPVGTTVPSRIRHDFSRWLAALPHPCGMLLASDGLAGEAYPACVKLGLRIPDDFAVLGVDDNERFCESLRPTLSSILLDFSQAGWLAAELLHRVIDKPTLAPYVMTYEPLGIAPRGSTSVNVNRVNPIAERAKALVAELAVTGANVSDIARHFTCSRRLVELRFRESTGMSLLQAIRDARLDKACELLRNKSIAIGTIATQCGYISESALKAAFKNRFGMTMSDWRRRAHPSLCGETPHLRWGGVRTSPDERVARNCHNHSNISPITLTRQIAAFP